MNKSFTESAVLSASLLGIGSNATRFSDGNDTTNSNCHACLTSVVTNPEINILSDCNINEIHLNFFPPSATYIKSSTSAYPSSQVDLNPRSILNIDVHEKVRQKIIGDMESTEDKRKMSLGYFSHIALRRCDDSILNISIGNSSKITKRHKKNSWFLRRLWKFSHKRKSSTHKSSRWYFSPQLNKDDVYRLSTGSLNFLNDELIISINKRNYNDNQRRVSFEKIKHNNENQQPSEQVSRDFLVEFTKNNTDDGANELDCYMDEIKRRENGMF